uniref:RIBOSOMAL_L9 domain-containing protein n=1 Tax=Rhabditophanes sp. KR3021 TaxID=114890 RepID=A0AC35U0Q4_9BILA
MNSNILLKAFKNGVVNNAFIRNTWVLKRVVVPEATLPGCLQRNPNELPELQRYEVLENKLTKSAGDIKVILLQDIEGLGHQFDVVTVNRTKARSDLLLTGKASYASPFDLEYYAKLKEEMKDELAKRIRIPYEYIKLGRDLSSRIIPINVSMDNSWTLDSGILKSSLRSSGIDVKDDCLYLANKDISGPNFEIEAKLVRFYAVVNKQYIVPMLGKICHISSDDSRQVLYPSSTTAKVDKKTLLNQGLTEEKPYYSPTQIIDTDFDVVKFMAKRK